MRWRSVAVSWFFRTSQSSFRRNAAVLFSDELCYGSSCWSGALQNEWSVEKTSVQNQVFISENTECLRQLSWCCAAAGMIFAASGFYYFPFWFLCGAAIVYGFDTACDKECFLHRRKKLKEKTIIPYRKGDKNAYCS